MDSGEQVTVSLEIVELVQLLQRNLHTKKEDES